MDAPFVSATIPPRPSKQRDSTVPPAWRRQGSRSSALPARPAPLPDAADAPRVASDALTLRLAIGRGGLGFELERTAHLACLEITELVIALPAARFPLDVSGGVARFRHQRGVLQRASLELSAERLARWAKPKLRGVVGVTPFDVFVGVRPWGATIGLSGGGDDRFREPPRALAFDVSFLAQGEDVALIVSGARGLGLPKPATALALEAMAALVGPVARREGARFVVDAAMTKLVRALLPEAGARVPDTDAVTIASFAAAHDAWILHASRESPACEPHDVSTRALEEASLAQASDDARLAGDYDGARALDVALLERAPRHPGLAGRIAEIDAFVGGRAEAALATLAEAERGPMASHLTLLRAELLAETHDTRAALAAFERAGEEEAAPALAACAFERAALSTEDRAEASAWLDRAVARAPGTPRLRFRRVEARLQAGRLEDAMADVEHLEAQARGSKARYTVFARAGELWLRAGLRSEAAPLFERALRFVPDDADSLAGLGRALLARGRAPRAVALLARALDLLEAANAPTGAVRVDLARALATELDDRPAAIAHVRQVAHDEERVGEARALEGRWRAELGDRAGASLAYARLRDHAETVAEGPAAPIAGLEAREAERAREALAELLHEAARFERDVQRDRLAAQRHLAAALRLRPSDPALREAYRRIGAAIAGVSEDGSAPPAATRAAPAAELPVLTAPAVPSLPSVPVTAMPAGSVPPGRFLSIPPNRESLSPAFSPDDFANMEEEPSLRSLPRLPDDDDEDDAVPEAEDEARVEELTRRLQLDPTQDDVVDELSVRLLRLGRSHDLFALLAARLEDASPDRRAALIPKQREVLERLEADARARGNEPEADLFAMARKALDDT